MLFPTRSWVWIEIWVFPETLLGAKNGKHFSLGENVCVAGKKMSGLARHQQGQQSLQEDYLMQSHGIMVFSEELCPLVSLDCFAFWERHLHCYKQGSLKSASLSRLRRWRALKALAASTHGTSPVASLIISSECRNEMYFSGDFFSR